MNESLKNARTIVLIVIALGASAALFWKFGGAFGIVLAGVALSVASFWKLLSGSSVAWRGSEIKRASRPVGYAVAVVALFAFALLLLFAGVLAIVRTGA